VTADAPQTAARDVPLPATIAACHAMIGELLAQLNRANGRIAKMEHQLEQLLRRLYGRSAERLDPNQLVLFADLLKQLGPEAAPAPEPPAPPPAALGPLYDLMIREVLASKVIHTDDTPVDVLDRNLPETRVGRFWVYVGDGTYGQAVISTALANVTGQYRPRRRRRAPAPAPSPVAEPPNDNGLPEVILPGGPATISDAAEKLGRLLAETGQYYVRGGGLVALDRDMDGVLILRPIRPAALASVFESVAHLAEFTKENKEFVIAPAICREQDAKLIL